MIVPGPITLAVPAEAPGIFEAYSAYALFGILLAITVWAFVLRTDKATRVRDREDARAVRHKRRTAWIRYARARHLQLWRARAGPTYVLRGTRDQVGLVIDVFLSDTPATAIIRARALDPRPLAVRAWRPEVAGDVAELVTGERPPIGDAPFDEAYRVKSAADDVRLVLDDRVRGALLAVPNVTCFEYDQGDVRLEWQGADAGVADAAIDAVLAACRRAGADAYR